MDLNEKFKLDRSSAKIFKKSEEPPSYEYWLTQTPQKRIEAIEFLRQQYHGAQSRMEKVGVITKVTEKLISY